VEIVVGRQFNLNNVEAEPSNRAAEQSRNFLQQAIINNLLTTFAPPEVIAQIADVAAMFGLQRNDFLIRCLKQLQVLEKMSKIPLTLLIQKGIKFGETLTKEQTKELEKLEPQLIELGKLVFSNTPLPADALLKLHELIIKAVRMNIDAATFTQEVPIVLAQTLAAQAGLNSILF